MNETPEYLSLSSAMAAKEAVEKGASAADELRAMARAGKIVPSENNDSGMRYFIAPIYPNAKFLVRPGVPKAMVATGGVIISWPERDGDVWAIFRSGILATDDPILIEWCLAHSGSPEAHVAYHQEHKTNARSCGAPFGLCREQGIATDDWFQMKQAQIPLATRPQALNPGIDVDRYFNGIAPRGDKLGSYDQVVENNENAARERASGRRD